MYPRRSQARPRTSQLKKFGAPTDGWVANRALSEPGGDPQSGVSQGAVILENFIPRAGAVQLRRGKRLFAQLAEAQPVVALFAYREGIHQHFFAANKNKIYEISTGIPIEKSSGHGSGDWVTVQFATTGDVFLIGVNGVDPGFKYDGDGFTPLDITFAATGLTTADMTFCWVYKNRLYFVQKNSLTAWYMADADVIGGNAVAFPMAGIFGQGGALLFGQPWSLEQGDQGGLSEQVVFVSNLGEAAIFQGDDPSEAATWQKVGVYRTGTPMGKHAFLRGGGDIAVATTSGLVPLSKAISLDVTALNTATISYRISDAWQEAVTARGTVGWSCALWPEQRIAFVSPPDRMEYSDPTLFVSNTETGAWCNFTNWQVFCMSVFAGQMYFGSDSGQVFAALSTGSDNGVAYTGTVIPMFDDLGSPGSSKIGKVGRAVTQAFARVDARVTFKADYDQRRPVAPDATIIVPASTWGDAIWGAGIWGGGDAPTIINQGWQSVGGTGYAVSLAYQVTSGADQPLDDQLIRLEVTYSTAEMVT